jgi:signal transduction histidine kinase
MISKFIHRITRIGLASSIDILLYQRVLLTNSLTLAIIGFCLLLFGISVAFALYIHVIICIATALFVLPVLWLNYRHYFSSASLYLVHFVGLAVFAASYFAFQADRITETENWLYSLLAISVFLFDGKRMTIHFVWFFALICFSKLVKYQIKGWPLDVDFFLMLINVAILCIALFVFLVIFKVGFMRALLNLSEANTSKSKLFSIIAHDIRSPLAVFESLLSLGKQGVISQEQFQKQQEHLFERMLPLRETINGLLHWSQANLDSIQPNPQAFFPKEKFAEVQETLQPLADSKDIDVHVLCEERQVFMDPEHFKIIVRNIYHNALKFSPAESAIYLTCEQRGDWMSISISDSGVGMTKNEIDSLLSGNVLASRSGTHGETGTGIGLSLSLELLRKNGGLLDITSEEGRGTTFIIKIPVMGLNPLAML